MKDLQAVFFDLHGTLTVPGQYDADGPAWSDNAIRCFAKLGVDTTTIDPATVCDELWDGTRYTAAADGTAFEHRLASYLNRKVGSAFTRADLSSAADAICAYWQGFFTVDPAAGPVIRELCERLRVGLISNFDHPPHVHRLLREAGLAELFGVIVISGDVGVEKPEPQIMYLACERLGVDAERSTYVGDSYVDYQAATAAGMRFFWLRRPEADAADHAGGDDRFARTDAELHRRAESGEITILRSLEELVVG